MDEVAGSSPAPPTRPHLAQGFSTSQHSQDALKGCAHAMSAFLLSRRVANVSRNTLDSYTRILGRFTSNMEGPLEHVTPLMVQKYLAGLQPTLKPVSVHKHFAVLRTFFAFALSA